MNISLSGPILSILVQFPCIVTAVLPLVVPVTWPVGAGPGVEREGEKPQYRLPHGGYRLGLE